MSKKLIHLVVTWEMVRILKYIILGWVAISSLKADEEVLRVVTSKQEPATMKEFSEITRPLVAKGAMEVRFKQGRWKWHSMRGLKVLEYDVSVTLKSTEDKWTEELDTWLKANRNKVDWLCIWFHPEHKASTFFKIEKVLTAHKIPYHMNLDKENAKDKLLLNNSFTRPVKEKPKKKVKKQYKKLPVAP